MYSIEKDITLYKIINFTEDEVKDLIKRYKDDCWYWYERQEQEIPFEEYIKDKDMFEDFIYENYLYDWNTFVEDRSDDNIYDFYRDVEKFL